MINRPFDWRSVIRPLQVLLVGMLWWSTSGCTMPSSSTRRLEQNTGRENMIRQDNSMSHGEQVHGQKTYGEQVNGQVNGQKTYGEQADAKKADGEERTDPAIAFDSQWMVSAPQSLHLIRQGATVLDAQGQGLGIKRFPGAVVVSWQQFSQSERPNQGKLLADDDRLTTMLQSVGIERDRPVVVFANPPHGWGEAGRIVWMLRTLGHPKAVMVDGGIQALLANTTPAQRRSMVENKPPAQGDFVVDRSSPEENVPRPDWNITHDELQTLVSLQLTKINVDNDLDLAPDDAAHQSLIPDPTLEQSPPAPNVPIMKPMVKPIIIDTREPREYAGATPYGEVRGGHIPGAIHLYFKDLLTADGTLLPPAELHALLATYGLTRETPAIVYCTGGVRSGWLTTVLVSHGYQVQNYAGSMWEWSALSPGHYPLVF